MRIVEHTFVETVLARNDCRQSGTEYDMEDNWGNKYKKSDYEVGSGLLVPGNTIQTTVFELVMEEEVSLAETAS